MSALPKRFSNSSIGAKFISAQAENTASNTNRRRSRTVHPRTGGEHRSRRARQIILSERNIPMFGVGKGLAGRELDGKVWNQFPR